MVGVWGYPPDRISTPFLARKGAGGWSKRVFQQLAQESMFSILLAHWRIHWRLLALAGVGFLVAAFLLAISPLFLAAAREGSLRFELEQRLLEDLDIHFWVPFRPLDRSAYERVDALVQAKVADHLDWMTRGVVRYGSTPEFLLLLPGTPEQVQPNTPSVVVQFLEGVEEHARILEGHWWGEGATGADGNGEAVMGAAAARSLGLKVGDRLQVLPRAQEPQRKATVTLVGLVEPLNAREEFWLGYDRFGLMFQNTDAPPTARLFVNQRVFLDGLGKALAPESANYWWYLYIRKGVVTTDTVAQAAGAIRAVETQVSSAFPRSTAFTALDLAVARHQARQIFTSAPLGVLITFAVGVALLYIMVTGAVLVERQRGVLALLRSRGAAVVPMLLPLAAGAALLALVALLAAPLLAHMAVVALLVRPLETLSGADLPTALPLGVSYLAALAGALAALVAFLVPGIAFVRQTGVRVRQELGRPSTDPLVFRWYLDIFLLVVGGVLAWEFSRSEGAVSRSLLGPPSQNPFFMMTPLLLLLGSALLFLRVLPLFHRLLAAFFTPVAPAWGALGLWASARQPGPSLRLALLLMVGVGAVVVAASVEPTLTSSLGNPSGTSVAPSPDPVLEASLGALARLVLVALTLLACLGALLVAQAAPRERFVQMGVLQALGMPQPQVGRWLVLEHSLSLVASLLMGGWLGRQVALWVLPLLDTGVSNRFVLDVTDVTTNWLWVGGFVLTVTLSLLAPLLLTTRALGPLALRSGLRLGDEV